MKIEKIDDRTGCWSVLHAVHQYVTDAAHYFHIASERLKDQNSYDSERWEALSAARKIYAEELENRLHFMGTGIVVSKFHTPRLYRGFESLNHLSPKGNEPDLIEECVWGELQCWDAVRQILADPGIDRTTADITYRLCLHVEASISLLVSWSSYIQEQSVRAN